MYKEFLVVAAVVCGCSPACGAEFVRQLNQAGSFDSFNAVEDPVPRPEPSGLGGRDEGGAAVESNGSNVPPDDASRDDSQSPTESDHQGGGEGLPDPNNSPSDVGGGRDPTEIGTIDPVPPLDIFVPGTVDPSAVISTIVPSVVGYAELYLEVPFHSQVLISNQDSPRDYYVNQQGGHRALLVPVRRSTPARIGIAVTLSDARTSETLESAYQVFVDMKPGDRRHVRVSRTQMEERIQMKHLMGATAFAGRRAAFPSDQGRYGVGPSCGNMLVPDVGGLTAHSDPTEEGVLPEPQDRVVGEEDFDDVPPAIEEASERPEEQTDGTSSGQDSES